MKYLKITWDSDGSTDIFPLSKKTEEIFNKDIYAFLEHLRPIFGNFDNNSTWSVSDKAVVRRHRERV